MKNKKFLTLFQIDPLHTIDPKTDSTFKIILQALKLSHNVMYCTPDRVYIKFKETYVKARTLELSDKNKSFRVKGDYKEKKISDFDIVFIRQDPPFNMNYILNSYLIEIPRLIDHKKPFFVNSPKGIRNFSEKIFPLLFKNIIPETTISCDKEILEAFIKKHKSFILKPLFDKGGNGIFLLKQNDPNTKSLIQILSEDFKNPIILQEFLPNVKNGDKRIILIDGEPVGAVNRIPSDGNFKANLHLGGSANKTILTKKELAICKKIKPFLISNGLFFVGIDVIDGKLTEINVTSPTGIQQINKLNKVKIELILWKKLTEKVLRNNST